jgi:hypothetical protein
MVAVFADVTRSWQLSKVEPLPKNRGEENSAIGVGRDVRAKITHPEESVFSVILKFRL